MSKKYLVLCILLLLGSTALLQSQIPGDVDSNGTVDIIDLLTLVQYLIGLQPTIDPGAADVNTDGRVSLADVLCIYDLYILGTMPVPGTPDTSPGVGTISLKTEPYEPYLPDQEFYVKVMLNSGTQSLGAVDLTIRYDPAVLEYLDIEYPSNITQISSASPGQVRLRGFMTGSAEPAAEKHLATIKFRELGPGPADHPWQITVRELIDRSTAVIGTPAATPHTSHIINGIFGDVNMDQVVDIIDALVIANWYVGIYMLECDNRIGDVDNDNDNVDILDALIVAKKYVGLIDKFPVEEYQPEPIADL